MLLLNENLITQIVMSSLVEKKWKNGGGERACARSPPFIRTACTPDPVLRLAADGGPFLSLPLAGSGACVRQVLRLPDGLSRALRPRTARAARAVASPCSQRGFPCPGPHGPGGGLLTRLFTLTPEREAVCSLWHFPSWGICITQALPFSRRRALWSPEVPLPGPASAQAAAPRPFPKSGPALRPWAWPRAPRGGRGCAGSSRRRPGP